MARFRTYLPNMCLRSELVTLFYILLSSYGACLTLVLVSTGDNPSTGIQLTGPAVDVAIRDANARYDGVFRNATRKTVYKSGTMSCAASTEAIADEAGQMSQNLMDTDNAMVLLTAGCSSETMVLGDFAREWNALLLGSQAGSGVFANRDRFPTTVTFGPSDFAILTEATVFFIDRFRWRTVALLCERPSPEAAERSAYALVACASIQKALINGSGKYVIRITYFDPAQTFLYQSLLQEIAQRSRIILVYSDIAVIRKVLVSAAGLGMTDGDYVYLTAQSSLTRVESESLWRRIDDDDLVAFEAMKSLIILNNQSPDWKEINKTVKDIAERSRDGYNYSCKLEEVNDLSICAYESVMSLAEVLYQSPSETSKNGIQLAREFFNRTFDFDSRKLFISKSGTRSADVNFWRLDNETKGFERAWRYARTRRFYLSECRLSTAWPNRPGPPRDIPLCGFQREVCDVQSRLQIVGMALGTAAALALCVVGLFVVRRASHKADERSRAVWLLTLDPAKLIQLNETQLQLATMRDPLLKQCQGNVVIYHEKLYWIQKGSKPMSQGQILSNNKAVALASKMKSISHPNIVEFFGVYASMTTISLLWRYGNRGTLRSFLDSGRVSPELRIPMCWDVITGLQHLQRTGLKFHGRLSSLCCMVDQQFSVQLCGAITARFFGCISAEENVAGATSQALRFWLAPELLHQEKPIGTAESDTYALGIIVCEIVTGRYPMDISLSDPQRLKDKSTLLEKDADRIAPNGQVSDSVAVHLLGMMHSNPVTRPTLQKTIAVFAHSYQRANIVDSLIRRLARFANELQIQVEARTRDLLEEQFKVDNLLAEIMPGQLVGRLRNKEPILPEGFDSVTLLFSALPEFAEICEGSAPGQIVSLLHSVYVLLDEALSNCDAYKVETVKDSYMVVSGLPVRNGELHAGHIARLALQMHKAVHRVESPVSHGSGLVLRIGIHSGACVATVVGRVMPRYCLFGDTVNTCSRMESSGLPDKIQVSLATKSILESTTGMELRSRGTVFVKGKGDMETFWLEDPAQAGALQLADV